MRPPPFPDLDKIPRAYHGLLTNSLYVPEGMFLTGQVQTTYTTNPTVVEFNVLQLLPDGRIQRNTLVLSSPTDRTILAKSIGLSEGWILSATGIDTNQSLRRGQLFVSLMATFSPSSASSYPPFYTFFQTYIGIYQNASWTPGTGGRIEMSTEGSGYFGRTTNYTANPAAGAECVQTVPAGTQIRIRSIMLQLATDANVATRTVQVFFRDASNNNIASGVSATNQTAGLTYRYNIGEYGSNATGVGANMFVNIPPGIVLPQGAKMTTVTTNIQVGDQWTFQGWNIEEFVEQ